MEVTMLVSRPGTVSPFSIGDPGRAALELPAGRPGPRPGLADVELSAATVPGMVIQAATCRGLQHRAAGSPRQDAFAIARCCPPGGPERAIAVVCDGVGSLGRSDRAAALASRLLARLGAAGESWPDAFIPVNQEVRAAAERALCEGTGPAAELGMATTAVAVAVHREEDTWAGEVAWVGDSALWHLSPGGRWSPVTGSPGEGAGAYHSTAVSALPSADGGCAFREFRIHGGALFVMSDGVANPLKWSDDVQDTLAGWWRQPGDPFSFAAQVAFARKTHMDDRTAIGIWPDAAVGAAPRAPAAGPPPPPPPCGERRVMIRVTGALFRRLRGERPERAGGDHGQFGPMAAEGDPGAGP
jgi:protein phosphatase 2C-like protein